MACVWRQNDPGPLPCAPTRRPVRQFLPSGTQYYTIPGNHDYYSTLGGQGFFNTVDQLRAEGVTQQQGSFWALEGANWVFIGLDTGATDTNPLAVSKWPVKAAPVSACSDPGRKFKTPLCPKQLTLIASASRSSHRLPQTRTCRIWTPTSSSGRWTR